MDIDEGPLGNFRARTVLTSKPEATVLGSREHIALLIFARQTRLSRDGSRSFLNGPPILPASGCTDESHSRHHLRATLAEKFNDPEKFPWTMGWAPSYQSEAGTYAKYILENYPGKTVGILYQNDDLGKEYVRGVRQVFGEQASKIIVSEVPFETSFPTIDSQVVSIGASKPDIFMNFATPKFAAQAIKKNGEIGWKPIHFLSSVSTSVAAVLTPAGLENSQGVISNAYLKDPNDPQWKDDSGIGEWRAFRKGTRKTASPFWIRRRRRIGSGPQAMRRRSHARERNETSRES